MIVGAGGTAHEGRNPDWLDLVRRLRGLSRSEHDDLSVCADAADEIVALMSEIFDLFSQSVASGRPGWVMVPTVELSRVLARVSGARARP